MRAVIIGTSQTGLAFMQKNNEHFDNARTLAGKQFRYHRPFIFSFANIRSHTITKIQSLLFQCNHIFIGFTFADNGEFVAINEDFGARPRAL